MTLPNILTIGRICLIPVFALAACGYSASIEQGHSDERLRMAAAGIFIVASVTDVLDGFLARRYNQRTQLGRILDPIADKGLVATAILTIVLGPWPNAFPVWFAVAVLGRDSLLAIGFFILFNSIRGVTVHASLLGKVATALQITTILWVLFGIRWISQIYPSALATFFTLVSGAGYVLDAFWQTRSAGRRRL
jgi:CDP-diacylglycerol--glycerol-3-phosphate 3-phosphatidyltransferase